MIFKLNVLSLQNCTDFCACPKHGKTYAIDRASLVRTQFFSCNFRSCSLFFLFYQCPHHCLPCYAIFLIHLWISATYHFLCTTLQKDLTNSMQQQLKKHMPKQTWITFMLVPCNFNDSEGRSIMTRTRRVMSHGLYQNYKFIFAIKCFKSFQAILSFKQRSNFKRSRKWQPGWAVILITT